jgi:hypothetical protein
MRLRCICNRDAFAMRSQCVRTAFTMCVQCVRAAFAMLSRCIRDAFALHSRCVCDVCAMRSRCISNAIVICSCYDQDFRNAFAMHSRCGAYALAMRLQFDRDVFAISLRSRCIHAAVAMRSCCICHAFAMRSPCIHSTFFSASALIHMHMRTTCHSPLQRARRLPPLPVLQKHRAPHGHKRSEIGHARRVRIVTHNRYVNPRSESKGCSKYKPCCVHSDPFEV